MVHFGDDVLEVICRRLSKMSMAMCYEKKLDIGYGLRKFC